MTTARVKLVDPKRLNARLYAQMDKLLKRLEDNDEEITTPQFITAIKTIAQVMILQANLKAKNLNEPTNPGSSVRRYASAFQKNAARGRTDDAGSGDLGGAFDDDDDPAIN